MKKFCNVFSYALMFFVLYIINPACAFAFVIGVVMGGKYV